MQFTAGYLVAGAMLRQGAYSPARHKLLGLRTELEGLQPERSFTEGALAVDGALLSLLHLESASGGGGNKASAILILAGQRHFLLS
ncbi:hypothetical protein ACFV2H_17990 [Streptomyces sp. NPDC059629]|uniref:hypothetical protein n=1 Tax=Streptomyces sp. NPDC059629 TaxID=3346889 RepID=UPI00369B5E4E